eukprot:1735361-Alexandrium_andersonii.AAC.1
MVKRCCWKRCGSKQCARTLTCLFAIRCLRVHILVRACECEHARGYTCTCVCTRACARACAPPACTNVFVPAPAHACADREADVDAGMQMRMP